MNEQKFIATDKGLLAMIENTTTCNKQSAMVEIPKIEEAKRLYKEMIFTTGRDECNVAIESAPQYGKSMV